MKVIKKIENRIKEVITAPLDKKQILYVFLTFIFVLSTDSLWTYTWSNRNLFKLVDISVLMLAVLAFGYFLQIYRKIKLQDFAIIGVIFIALIANLFANRAISKGYLIKFSYPLIGVLLCREMNFKRFARAFVSVMVFLTVYSLILYLMANLRMQKNLPIITNIANKSFYNGILGFIAKDGNTIIRNWGVFWEPGTFQAYISFAIIIDLFYLKNTKPYKTILFIITVVTTMSTTGYIVVGIILLLYIFSMKGKQYNVNKIVILSIILLGIIFIFANDKLRDFIFGKIKVKNKKQTASFGARYYSVIGNLRIMFTDGLIVGTGIKNYVNIYQATVNSMGYFKDMSNTATIFVDIARFGWLYGGINVYLIFMFSKKLGKTVVKTIGILVILSLLFMMENFSFSLFWSVLPYCGLTIFKESKKDALFLSV